MPQVSWVQHVGGVGNSQVQAALNNTTTETDISPGGASNGIWLPANTADYTRFKLHIVAWGVWGCTTGSPTLRFCLYPNGLAGGNLLAMTGDIACGASAITNGPWRLEWYGVITAIGTTGTIKGSGYCQLGAAPQTAPTVATWQAQVPMPSTAIADTTINTTQNNLITLTAKWSAANALNTVTCHDLTVLNLC